MNNIHHTNGHWVTIIILLLIWEMIWKGIALWKAARQNQKTWYVFLLILNTAGILQILYIYIFSKKAKGNPQKVSTANNS